MISTRIGRILRQPSTWRHRSIARNAIAAMAVVLAMFAVPVKQAHAGNPTQVTVTILRFKELQDPDSGILEQDHGEYYGSVNIDNQGYQDGRALGYGEVHNGADISPYWRFTAAVDPNLGTTIPVSIQIKDDDTGVPFAVDDVMDINPQPNVRELHLSFNLLDGSWTDTDNNIANVGWSRGNGDTGNFSDGGEQGAVLFDIGFGNGNLSGDGIPDGIKRFGVRNIDSGALVADMAALGADPCRKTVAIQIDYMNGAGDGHTHKPQAGAISLAQNAYNNAPINAVSACPYPGFPTKPTGIKLILNVVNPVPELPVMQPDDANFTADKQAGFPDALSPYFFYLIMVHDQAAGSSSSGLSCGANSKDFIVSLGSWANETGTASDQGSSIMHELGHCLGLGHGGADGVNCKPNYLSVMNYDFQITGIPSATGGSARYDYSREALPSLNESALQEKSGLGGDGKDLTAWTPDNGVTELTGPTSGPLDWDNNADNGTDANPVNVDLNALSGGNCGTVGTTPNPSPNETLTGYDDWNNLQYRAPLASTASGSGVTHPGEDDVTYPQALAAKAFWATTFVTSAGAAPLSGVESAALGTVTLATVADSEPSAQASNFTATVDWGDGSTSPGTLSGPTGGPFTIQGSHTYSEEGVFPITTSLHDRGGARSMASTSATIADAALSSTGRNIVTTNPFSGTVATFTDADSAGTAADYTASIDWGDGTSTTGVVVPTSTGFGVTGGHSFATLGSYAISISIRDAGGSQTSATSTLLLFAFPAYGDFVLGNVTAQNASPTTAVTWWGAQWSKMNVLSGGPASNSFKGFAAVTSPAPPACGGTWSTTTGNSSSPPATVPSYMGVAVASEVSKSGSTIHSENIVKIVVVRTAPGYSPDPSSYGTGYVVATYCG